jgi:cell wall-associated NlpC family hydrolase
MINRPQMLLVISACGALSLARGADASSSSSDTPVPHHASATADSDSDIPAAYRVDKGDTLGSVAHQFHCSIAALRELNDLHRSHLKTGSILKIPGGHRGHDTASAHHTKKQHATADQLATDKKTASRHHHTLAAQPVQDFDVSPSTFASCPVPAANEAEDTEPAIVIPDGTPITSTTPTGPVTTPADLPPPAATEEHHPGLLPVPQVAATEPPEKTTFAAHHNEAGSSAAPMPSAAVLAPPEQKKNGFATALANFFGGSHAPESGAWGNRFLSEARDLADRGIGYDDSWRPEGETHSWAMDCSNTSRYLYRVTAGIELPRTASDQYYYLHLQDKAWDVPMTSRGFADCNYLRSNLKPGDLLFWENTYRPERQPPITHVMIFLGTDSSHRWLMAGSQSGHHGLYNPHRNGPDVYIFDPTHYSGGYTTWLGLVHHKGRFVAYGRPLEADVKKLSVAEND